MSFEDRGRTKNVVEFTLEEGLGRSALRLVWCLRLRCDVWGGGHALGPIHVRAPSDRGIEPISVSTAFLDWRTNDAVWSGRMGPLGLSVSFSLDTGVPYFPVSGANRRQGGRHPRANNGGCS